jgi:glycine/D-amino acid oxidase-like deaminating enzyme
VVVLAAGPWSAPLAASAGLNLPVEPRKGQLVRLRLPQPSPGFIGRKVVDGSYLLSVGSPDPGRQISTVIETTWDGHVVVGSTRERSGFDPAVDDQVAHAVRARAARLVPELSGLELDGSWVGFRPWLPDHLPALGESRAAPGFWVGTGHEGAGVVLGPISGRLLAQAITGETASIDLTRFDPDRFT